MKKTLSMFLAGLVLLFIAGIAWAAFEKEEPTASVSDFAPDVGPVANSPGLPLWPGVDMITWTTGANMDTARYGAVAGWYNGEVYFAHGRQSNAVPYNSSECASYNPVTNAWTHHTNAPTARRMVGAGVVQSGTYIHSVGGRFDATTTVGTYERYDMATDTWVTLAPCTPRWAHGAAALANGDVYVFGGSDATVNTSVQKYDPATNSWSAVASLPVGRGWVAGASLNGKVYCIAGSGANTMYEYDPALNTWTARAPLPTNRLYHWAYGDPVANKIYCFGGATVSAPTADVVVWDAATNTWAMDDPMPGPRNWPSVGGNMAGTAFVCGGFDGSAIYYNQTWIGDLHAANPLAPAAPTGFTVANNGLALTATLSWTNPTLTVNGQTLTSIDSVIVKRGTTIVASLFGSPGQAMTYNDNVPSVGTYGYMVAAVNSYGEGIPANGSAWIGLDTPGAPTNVIAVPGWLTATVTWTAPTAGQHGGYWPPGSWDGQKIYRDGVLLNTITGTNTSYTDTPTQGGNYVYGVAYYNASGDGPTVNAPSVLVLGPGIYVATQIPYNWVEINPAYPGALPGINSGLNADDQNVGPFPVGFDFPWYFTGTANTVRMCSNGWATFSTSTTTALTNAVIPSTAVPNDLLAVYWDDLNMNPTSGSGAAFYYTDVPNNRFIMEWDSVSHYGSTITGEWFTFEIILYLNGTIEYMYKAIVPGTMVPPTSASVGIENGTGTVGTQCTYNGSGPLEPRTQIGIRIAEPTAPGGVTVTLLPVNPPIIIPPTGGPFDWDITLHNGEATPQTIDIWNVISGPATRPGWGPYMDLTMPAGATINRIRTQYVSDRFPPGAYTYTSNIGDYPGTILDSDSFPFTKTAVGDDGWAKGESSTGLIPTEYALHLATPNPFNPTTTLGFDLPQAGPVQLTVYNVSGQEVATLVNGWRNAGIHEVTFDGSALASGLYVYQLSAGDFHATGKMMLMK